MSQISLLLPFSLPPPEMARDLLRELRTPALATLVSCAAGSAVETAAIGDQGWNYALPHESWLARQCGLRIDETVNSPPTAVAAMRGLGLSPDDGYWFIVSPAHIEIARNRLLLADARSLQLAENDARALFDAASPYFEELGKRLLYGDALHWFVRADDWRELRTATMDATLGQNMDAMMPHGPAQLAWRKLQNEIQMLWFTDAVNARREETGKALINAMWLSGGAAASDVGGTPQFDALFETPNQDVAWTCLGALGRTRSDYRGLDYVDAIVTRQSKRGLLLIDALSAAANATDWSAWLAQMQQLEEQCFIPLLAALRAGHLHSVKLVATRRDGLLELTTSRNGLRKFWIRPSLKRLNA